MREKIALCALFNCKGCGRQVQNSARMRHANAVTKERTPTYSNWQSSTTERAAAT
jgi:hypothetical protein